MSIAVIRFLYRDCVKFFEKSDGKNTFNFEIKGQILDISGIMYKFRSKVKLQVKEKKQTK